MKNKLLLSILLLILLPLFVQATHIYSSYITYTQDAQNPLKYNFTFMHYVNPASTADEPEVQINMGDGNWVIVPRKSIQKVWKGYNETVYTWSYTYASPGDYTIYWVGENRNGGLLNVTQPSDQYSVIVYTDLNTANGNLHSPALAGLPVFEVYSSEKFTHNLLAYDADGDYLTYELTTPLTNSKVGLETLPGYRVPEGLKISKLGEISWETPEEKGQYVTSVRVTEWRNGQRLSSMLVDIVFNVVEKKSQSILTLLNKSRYPLTADGAIQVAPGQSVKLEFYLQRQDDEHQLVVKKAGELDTLQRNASSVAVRDTTDGYALTLSFTATADLQRPHPYLVGLKGAAIDVSPADLYNSSVALNLAWSFAYLQVGPAQTPTSANDKLAKAGFFLYPNPVQDKFVVDAPDMPAMHLQFFDATGKAVQVLQLQPGRNTFTKPGTLAQGIYFYTISSRYKPVGSGRLVVR